MNMPKPNLPTPKIHYDIHARRIIKAIHTQGKAEFSIMDSGNSKLLLEGTLVYEDGLVKYSKLNPDSCKEFSNRILSDVQTWVIDQRIKSLTKTPV